MRDDILTKKLFVFRVSFRLQFVIIQLEEDMTEYCEGDKWMGLERNRHEKWNKEQVNTLRVNCQFFRCFMNLSLRIIQKVEQC